MGYASLNFSHAEFYENSVNLCLFESGTDTRKTGNTHKCHVDGTVLPERSVRNAPLLRGVINTKCTLLS